jgi:hypothetical protein
MGDGLEGSGWIPDRGKSTASRPALESTQWVPRVLSLAVKRLECEADHSPLSSAEVKNGGAVPPILHMSSWHGA